MSANRDTLMKWVVGLFSGVILFLLSLAFSAAASSNKTNADQDLQILRLQLGDSVNGRRLERVETKVDSILSMVRRRS